MFVPGSQNDFHEVFTLVLEELEKGMPVEEDKKFIRKIFYGKSRVSLVGSKEPPNDSLFSIINLSSKAASFEKALSEYKREKLEGYVNSEGSSINAEREIDFLETPALLTFFVNRVEYREKKLVKDSSEFDFQEKIFFSKTNLKSGVKNPHDSGLETQENNLREWLEKIEVSKVQLENTLNYIEEKEFENINLPAVNNPRGEESKETTKLYLKAEIEQIQLMKEKVAGEIDELRRKRIKLAEENYS